MSDANLFSCGVCTSVLTNIIVVLLVSCDRFAHDWLCGGEEVERCGVVKMAENGGAGCSGLWPGTRVVQEWRDVRHQRLALL